MLLSGVMSFLTLVVTIARTAPLTSSTLDLSTNLLHGRGLDDLVEYSYPELTADDRQRLDKRIKDLDNQLSTLSRYPETKLSGPTDFIDIKSDLWLEESPKYRKVHEAFEAAIWKRYPLMETHVKRVFHVALKVEFYEFDFLGQRILSTPERGVLDVVELGLARAILKRETIGREHKNEYAVGEFTRLIEDRKLMWQHKYRDVQLKAPRPELEEAYERHRLALQERCDTYNAEDWSSSAAYFVFYATNSPVGENAEVEAHLQHQLGKYLETDMFRANDITLIKWLAGVLDRMARPRDHQALLPEKIAGNAYYAQLQELFQALWIRQAKHWETRYDVTWPRPYKFKGDPPGAPKRMNVLEAEITRRFVLAKSIEKSDKIGAIHHYLAMVRLWEKWNADKDDGQFSLDMSPKDRCSWLVNDAKKSLKQVINEDELPRDLQDEISRAVSES